MGAGNKCWYNILKHPTGKYHVEFTADSGEKRFRMNSLGSSLTQEEVNLLRYFDRTLHAISTQLLLQECICFLSEAVYQELQEAPVHQRF